MSYEDGVYVNDVHAIRAMGLSPIDVARVVSEAFCEQIFVHGIVHADPHFAK
jgi:aarF domain-containing kinase